MLIRPLNETVAVLTASGGGIALEIACQLAEAGAAGIVINGRSREGGDRALAALRARAPEVQAIFFAGDATRSDTVASIRDAALERFGRIDLLVTAVGGGVSPRPLLDMAEADLQDLAERHFLSTVRACHAVLPAMVAQGGGVILNIASDAAKVPTPGETVIGGLKAGVAMFTRTLALEVGRNGIRAHCLTPSIVRGTAGYEKLMQDAFSARLFRKAESRASLGVTEAADVARLAVFLASPAAHNMTGQVISVNGGISAG